MKIIDKIKGAKAKATYLKMRSLGLIYHVIRHPFKTVWNVGTFPIKVVYNETKNHVIKPPFQVAGHYIDKFSKKYTKTTMIGAPIAGGAAGYGLEKLVQKSASPAAHEAIADLGKVMDSGIKAEVQKPLKAGVEILDNTLNKGFNESYQSAVEGIDKVADAVEKVPGTGIAKFQQSIQDFFTDPVKKTETYNKAVNTIDEKTKSLFLKAKKELGDLIENIDIHVFDKPTEWLGTQVQTGMDWCSEYFIYLGAFAGLAYTGKVWTKHRQAKSLEKAVAKKGATPKEVKDYLSANIARNETALIGNFSIDERNKINHLCKAYTGRRVENLARRVKVNLPGTNDKLTDETIRKEVAKEVLQQIVLEKGYESYTRAIKNAAGNELNLVKRIAHEEVDINISPVYNQHDKQISNVAARVDEAGNFGKKALQIGGTIASAIGLGYLASKGMNYLHFDNSEPLMYGMSSMWAASRLKLIDNFLNKNEYRKNTKHVVESVVDRLS